MAKAREAVVSSVPKAIVKLFADLSSPVLVDECGEVKVCLMRKVGGNTVVQGPQVDFAKPWFVEANDGDEFAIDLENTDKLDLQRVLAPRPGRYQAQAYDRNKRAIVRAVVVIEVEPDPAAADPEEPEDPDGGDPDPETDESGSTVAVKMLARLVEKQIGQNNGKNAGKDSDAIDVLRDEIRRLTASNESMIRDMGNRHEDDLRRLKTESADALRALQAKHDNEVATVWLDTKTAMGTATARMEEERKEYNADRRTWGEERRSMVDRYETERRDIVRNYEAQVTALKTEISGETREARISREGELRELRIQYETKLQTLTVQSETKIQELQGRLLDAQSSANEKLLGAHIARADLDLERKLALRDAADSKNFADATRIQAEHERIETDKTMRELATRAGNGSAIGQLVAGIPAAAEAFKGIARVLKDDSGKPLPTDAKQLLAFVAANPDIVKQLREDPAAVQQVQELLFPVDESSWSESVQAPEPQAQPEPQWRSEPAQQAQQPVPAQPTPVHVEVVEPDPEPVPPVPAWDGVSRPSVTFDPGSEPVEPAPAPVPDPIPPEAQVQAE